MIKKLFTKSVHVANCFNYWRLQGQIQFPSSEAFIICGDPRGGTTWLAEMINEIPLTAMIWEPLAIKHTSNFRKLGFHWRQYIPEDALWPEARLQFEMVLSGRFLSPYLCQATSIQELRRARHLLVKFCRATQLLPWLTKNFHFKFAPLYIVRHPCAVVASQLKQGGWKNVSSVFDIPEDGRHREFYIRHQTFLKTIDSVEKRLAATWCLCNEVALKHNANNQNWITLTYEDLLNTPKQQLSRIEQRWEIKLPEHLFSKGALTSSFTTVKDSPIITGDVAKQLNYWKTSLSSRQISDIMSVVDYFKIDLYDHSPYPRHTFE